MPESHLEPEKTPPTGSDLLGKEPVDIGKIAATSLNFLKNPPLLLETILSTAKSPARFFEEGRDGDINDALGFLGSILVYLLAFGLLGSLFSLNWIGFVLILPFTLMGAGFFLLIGSLIVWALGIFAGKGVGTLMDGAKVVCLLSWISLINAFPVFVWFPLILQTLISVACLALWAYLLIPVITVKFKTARNAHQPVIWAVAGFLAFFQLMGGILGTGAEVAGDRFAEMSERAIQRAEAEAERISAEVAAEIARQQALAEQAQPPETGAPSPAPTGDPKK